MAEWSHLSSQPGSRDALESPPRTALRPLVFLLKISAVFVFYFVAGRLGLAVPYTNGNVSPFWPPAGVALAAVLLLGYEVWPGIVAGAFLVNFFTPIPHSAALGLAVGNTLGPLLGAFLFRRQGCDPHLHRLRDVLGLIAFGALGTATSATLGVLVLYATGVDAWTHILDAWLIWWLGDNMGVLLLAPFLLTGRQLFRRNKNRQIEFVGIVVLVMAVCIFLFDSRVGITVAEDLLAFAVFPLVMWAAVRFEVAGAAAISCVAAGLTVWETALGLGPFVRHGSPLHNAAILQSFLAVISGSGLLLAVVMTEKRQAQTALQRQSQRSVASMSERLQLAQQAANIGAWEWNLRTSVISWSPELEQLHGFPIGGFDGKYESWLQTVHPDDRELVQAEVLSAIRDQRQYDVEYRSVRPDGSTYWTAARGRVLVERGEPERLVGICMDISSRRMAEEALRNSEKLAATGRLAATMAHEINNPLEGVTNLVFLARSDSSLTAQTREYLRLAEEELRRIGHIANRALVFYRDSASPKLVEVSQILDEVLNIFQHRIENKHLRVVRRYRGPSKLVCNAAEIRQVVSNVLLNALDASPKGGVLHIRVAPAAVACDANRNGVRICIADHGPGIRSEHKNRIFEPFFTTKQDLGTGLGLWVSHGIVDKHEGRIRVRSSTRSGRSGTVFSIFIPSRESAVASSSASAVNVAQGVA